MLKPKLFTCLKDYSKQQFFKDISAGLIVAIIAFPLSIAFAASSGVSPEKGLLTAIIGSFIVAALGGSRVQVAGPTGAFVIITLDILQKHGLEGLMIATIMAGVILIILGLLKFGDAIKYIPHPITTGFTSAIGVLIFFSQISDFLGIKLEKQEANFFKSIFSVIQNIEHASFMVIGIGIISLVILNIIPKFTKRIPGSLVAIIITTIIVSVLKIDIPTIESKFGGIELAVQLPEFSKITFSMIIDLLPSAFTIAILAGIVALLSAVVADGMLGSNHRSNMELIANGFANIAVGLIGGIPVTGAVARTTENTKNGARTPIAAMASALLLLLITVIFLPLINKIPVVSLAAILLFVSWNMIDWAFIAQLKNIPLNDSIVFVITLFLSVAAGLVIGIFTGLILASMLFMKRVSDISSTELISHDDKGFKDTLFKESLPEKTAIYEIRGSFFFGAADKFAKSIRNNVLVFDNLIIKMDQVQVVDATGLNALERFCREMYNRKIDVYLVGLNEKNKQIVFRHRLINFLNTRNIVDTMKEAKTLIEQDLEEATKEAQNLIAEDNKNPKDEK